MAMADAFNFNLQNKTYSSFREVTMKIKERDFNVL